MDGCIDRGRNGEDSIKIIFLESENTMKMTSQPCSHINTEVFSLAPIYGPIQFSSNTGYETIEVEILIKMPEENTINHCCTADFWINKGQYICNH